MNLTPYQAEKFPHLEKSIKDGQWYIINPDRPDIPELIECIKLFIDYYGTLEFNKDYSAFRRAYPPATLVWLSRDNSSTMKMVDEFQIAEAHRLGLSWTKKKK